MYKYCPYCKGHLDFNDSEYEYLCKNCGQKIYINASATVSVIPVKNNKILLSKRAREPFKGEVDVIGGFVRIGETTEEAVIRETKEETGLDVKITKYLGQFTEFKYKKHVTYPLSFAYVVKITGGRIKPNDDVSELFWVDSKNIKNVDTSKSFPSLKYLFESLSNYLWSGI